MAVRTDVQRIASPHFIDAPLYFASAASLTLLTGLADDEAA